LPGRTGKENRGLVGSFGGTQSGQHAEPGWNFPQSPREKMASKKFKQKMFRLFS
jgi:hypothetical protein